MSFRKRFFSGALLGLYLMLIAAQSLHHDALHHQHSDQKHAHHVHDFHIGLFHFLGHLIHNIQEVQHDASDHQLVLQSIPNPFKSQKSFFDNQFLATITTISAGLIVHADKQVNDNCRLLLQRTLSDHNPLRAPPAVA